MDEFLAGGRELVQFVTGPLRENRVAGVAVVGFDGLLFVLGLVQAVMAAEAAGPDHVADIDVAETAELYDHGSVIESRLVRWLANAYKKFGVDLTSISSTVAASGEGQWTVDEAHRLGIPAPIIEGSLEFRKQSAQNPSYAGRVLSALRNQFGGHEAARKD